MKTLHKLLLLCLVLIIFSCKKSSSSNSSGDDSYVKIKKNGTFVTYKGLGELGPDLGNSALTDLGISGSSSDAKEVFNLDIQLEGSNFTTGTYFTDVYTPYYVLVSLTVTDGASSAKYYDVDDAASMAPSKYTVIISSITPTQITGSFTGNYLYDNFSSGDADGGVLPITEGEFKVKRIR